MSVGVSHWVLIIFRGGINIASWALPISGYFLKKPVNCVYGRVDNSHKTMERWLTDVWIGSNVFFVRILVLSWMLDWILGYLFIYCFRKPLVWCVCVCVCVYVYVHSLTCMCLFESVFMCVTWKWLKNFAKRSILITLCTQFPNWTTGNILLKEAGKTDNFQKIISCSYSSSFK